MSIDIPEGKTLTIGDRRRDFSDAEQSDILKNSLRNDIDQLRDRNVQLARRIADLEEDNADLRNRLTRVQAQLRAAEKRQ